MSSVSLAGSLEDLGLNDILQILALSRKSGVLRLACRNDALEMFIHGGNVVGARPHPSIAALHSFFRERRILDNEQMQVFLHVLKNKAFKAEPWTEFWAATFRVEAKTAEDWAEQYLTWLVARAGHWDTGDFSFELDPDGAALGKVRKVPVFPTVADGLSAQYLAMESARLLDESSAEFVRPGGPAPDEATITGMMPEPAADEGTQVSASAASATSDDAATAAAAEGLAPPQRILFVDVKPESAEAVAKALRGLGYPQVATAQSVGAAAQTIERAAEDDWVVVSELVIPKRDRSGVLGGLEVAQELNNHPKVREVLLCSDLINDEIREQGTQAGAREFIAKPARKAFKQDQAHAVARFVKAMAEVIGPPPAAPEPEIEDPLAGHEAFEISLDDPLAALMQEEGLGAPIQRPRTDRGMNLLRHMIEELTNPNAESEVSLLILRFAADFFQRAVFFAVTPEYLSGLGEVGLALDNADQVIRGLRIPLDKGSIFDEVVKTRQSYRGRPMDHAVHQYLFERFGGTTPHEVYVAPVLAGGRIVAMLYADQVPTQTPLRDTETVEVFLAQAGLALERAYLLKQLRELDRNGKGT